MPIVKPQGHDGIPPDRFQLTIRFITGFVAGAVVGSCNTMLFLDIETVEALVTFTAVTAVVGGLLAMFIGDRFWRWITCLF